MKVHVLHQTLVSLFLFLTATVYKPVTDK